MRTLDEVIKAFELCIPTKIRCLECPYHENGCPDDRKKDALHYLKHLQEYYNMSREHHEPNPALTLEQLKQMEGKPVWVEIDGYNGYWTIVHWNSNIVFEACITRRLHESTDSIT